MRTKSILQLLFLLIPYIISAQQKEKDEITQMLDKWHLAAANADQTAYFEGIDEDGIYIGTDATEIWTKQEFFEWSKPYFDKGKAWNLYCHKKKYLSL